MNKAREQHIANFAEQIWSKFNFTSKTNPELIASVEKITVSDGHYDHYFEAMIEYCSTEKNHPFHIYLNLDILKHRHYLRSRSAFCHELGHYFIPEHKKILLSGKSLNYDSNYKYVENPIIEQEADCFSANLLMPPSLFKGNATKLNYGLKAILELSHQFDTSVLSTALQYVKADLNPSVLVKWTADNKIEWKYVSNLFKKSIPRSYHFQFNQLRPTTDFELDEFNNYGKTINIGTTHTNLSSWVYDVRFGSPKDILLVEQTMPLGKYGGVSLLRPAT